MVRTLYEVAYTPPGGAGVKRERIAAFHVQHGADGSVSFWDGGAVRAFGPGVWLEIRVVEPEDTNEEE